MDFIKMSSYFKVIVQKFRLKIKKHDNYIYSNLNTWFFFLQFKYQGNLVEIKNNIEITIL